VLLEGLYGRLLFHLVGQIEIFGDLCGVLDQANAHALVKGLNCRFPDHIFRQAHLPGVIGSGPEGLAVYLPHERSGSGIQAHAGGKVVFLCQVCGN